MTARASSSEQQVVGDQAGQVVIDLQADVAEVRVAGRAGDGLADVLASIGSSGTLAISPP